VSDTEAKQAPEISKVSRRSAESNKLRNAIIVVAVGAVLWFVPAPSGLTVSAWRLFSVFVATVLGLILQPLPLGATAFIALTFCALTRLLTPQQALSGFGSTTIWLIVSAFLFARGFLKTGLGRRVAFLIMKWIGNSTLKLGYALGLSDLVMSPFMPSATPELAA
jgi:DASS family divalent anion:Na+ symporter